MFESKTKKSLTSRLADAVDLMIDFATLGEYGYEEPAPAAASSCTEGRRRSAAARFDAAALAQR